MRHSLGRAALAMMCLALLGACGQIGNTHASSSSSPSGSALSLPPGGAAATKAPPNVSLSPADTCVTVRQLSAVAKQVTDLFGRFDELEQSEDVVADLGELVSGFQAAQADLAAIPTVVEDRDITEARRLLGEAIAGFIAGLQELSVGYETNDQQTLVSAALKLDDANTTFTQEYQPAIETKEGCL
jgi:hypothetical protein